MLETNFEARRVINKPMEDGLQKTYYEDPEAQGF
jgi:hypothetical protein